jgi:cytochrome c
MPAIPGILALFLFATPAFAADPDAGKASFARCGICHRVGEGARNVVGPELNGVVGRPAASVPDYAYSQAMKASGVTWSEDNLRAFLAGPAAFMPHTKMAFAGMRDPAAIDDVIAFLKTFKPDGSPAP